MNRLVTDRYSCPKCRCKQFDIGEMHVAGSTLAKLFDIQNKKFSLVTCSKCGFTEMYKVPSSDLKNVLDFVIGG
ncbi:MAG TPA: zinc ribbon domain-containing protein [Tenuifilaceae bacterium]|nr:zinc ribbon domain-containing protein [Tenuifilaceae bacterium]